MRKLDRGKLDSLSKGSIAAKIYSYTSNGLQEMTVPVPEEMALTMYLDGEELVTVLCTPTKLTPLVLGYLFMEDVIGGPEDIASLRVCEEESLADVRLRHGKFNPPARRTLTSGCGGGTTFAPKRDRVVSDARVDPEEVISLMSQLNERAELYRISGGVHTSALGKDGNVLIAAEDIGRHNTIDKIMGECLVTGTSPADGVLITTGRISSEMLSKTAKMGVPVVVSRSSPTDKAVSLASQLDIMLIGYVRGNRFSIYTHEERLNIDFE